MEVLLSMAMIIIIVGTTIPIYQSFQSRSDLDVAVVTVAQSLRRAQSLAQSSSGDSAWGVYVQTANVTIFKGTNYSGHDATYDEVADMPNSVNPSTSTQIIFNKFSGMPVATGTITLISNVSSTRILTINSKGTVNY